MLNGKLFRNIDPTSHNPWVYFMLALGWSWVFWLPLVLLKADVSTVPGYALYIIGGLGPPLSAIFLVHHTLPEQKIRAYWRRVVDFRRIPVNWYAVIFLTAPLYKALALLTGFMVNGQFPFLENVITFLRDPLSILPFMITTLFYGPLPEELGWRGYALDGLQSKFNPLTSSLILAFFWSMWHFPMFFMTDSLQASVFPLGSTVFWFAMVPGILAETVLMTWIYNHTNRSTLSAILFHFMMNFTGEFLHFPDDIKVFQFVWLVVMAVVVVACGGLRKKAPAAD
jgi:membrane protease YdiL (CAAX protease family)